MFETGERGQKLSKQAYQQQLAPLRTELLQLQRQLREAGSSVLMLVSGVDGAGKGEVVNLLNEWLDPRYLHNVAFNEPSDEERERPEFWRFWRALPATGQIGLFIGSWYSTPIAQRVSGELGEGELYKRLLRIRSFERELIDEGTLIIKLWLHLSQDAQKRRLKRLASNPDTSWRVSELDRQHLKHYDHFRRIAEHTLLTTSSSEAPWRIIDSSDPYTRNITVARYLLEQLQQQLLQQGGSGDDAQTTQPLPLPSPSSPLQQLDMEQRLEKRCYKRELEKYQGQLHRLARAAQQRKISSVLVFEGWDASGKGGVIRRILPALEARNYRVIPIAAPSDEERAHHYLWRFWRHIPRAGRITIYDRSWYGRVLVERVEGYAHREEWQRAYAEINDFEAQLCEHRTVLLKYWLHIDRDEQLRRFERREQVSYKQFKITDEDYRNRERWDDYELAVSEMVERTSSVCAPWHLLEGNDKRFARIKALRLYCETLEQALDG